MASPGSDAGSQQSDSDHEESKENTAAPVTKKPGSKAQGRKRTKTGCLTCRKRRIKCGEEKPTCQNCTKSKRQCEGYNQRVVFKDPLNAYRPSLSTSSQVAFTGPMPRVGNSDIYAQSASGQNPLPIAPKPFRLTNVTNGPPPSALPLTSPSGTERLVYPYSENSMPVPDTVDRSRLPDPGSYVPQSQFQQHEFQPPIKREHGSGSPMTPPQTYLAEAHNNFNQGPYMYAQSSFTGPSGTVSEHSPLRPLYPPPSPWEIVDPSISPQTPFPTLSPTGPPVYARVEGANWRHTSTDETSERMSSYEATQWGPGQPGTFGNQNLEDEDDPFDISDDDINMEDYGNTELWQDDSPGGHPKGNDLGIVVALQTSQDNRGHSLRTFTSFIDGPESLTTYIPSSQSTPLRDKMTARIFCHFVNVIAPSMNMYERHPANPSLLFQGAPVPKSQQHIWAYTFPTLALRNPALLHAMLGVASLHIAKLQNGPITASLKHYAIGLRRVAKCVSIPSKRKDIATLAATLLLAFYELSSADHQKWSNHLLGARQLVRDIDFAGMTRYIKRRAQQQRNAHNTQLTHGVNDPNRFPMNVDEVDENIIGMLTGRSVRYDQYGHVIDDGDFEDDQGKHYTEKDLETYETQRDLFWWYCRQDVYQSILGGGRLFMEYSLWSHCPPRAPLGRLNATYGSYDHLMLLMGRLATFSAKDLKRKRLALKANGGHWRPPEHMQRQAQGNPMQSNQAPQTPQKPPQIPNFSGMVPGVREAQLPMGWEPRRDTSPQSSQSEDIDLHTLTYEAEEEWLEIRKAFGLLESHFGDDFQALGPEFSTPVSTPFGPALQYRTYGIAGIWLNYHMALIACHRSHPSMPPAAMMAAGITARQTAFHANEIGRISAGIVPDCNTLTHINPGVGSALMESSTALFLAGVQYQNPLQRSWTITRLRSIARLTGWQTALAIAVGCETSWIKNAEMGHGPVYERVKDDVGKLPDIWESSRRIDRALEGKSAEERRMVIERSDRVHYALGVLGLQEDFEGLDVDE